MRISDLIGLGVVGLGFAAVAAGVVVLAYLLLADLLSRASESHRARTPLRSRVSALPRRTVTPTQGWDSLAGDDFDRAFSSLRGDGSHDMPVSAWGHPAPITHRGVQEVEAGELPHQMWTRGRAL